MADVFKPTGSGNEILKGKGFFVSFRAEPIQIGIEEVAALFTGNEEFLHPQAETALVKDRVFYILNGDFRKDYLGIVDQGFDACLAFYESQKDEHDSIWSTARAGEV